jgi:starch phosphorylase
VRELMLERMFETERRYHEADAKRVYYLSMEFLIGRSLRSNLLSLGILEPVSAALRELGAHIERVESQEADAALGNGGLGRLAACFLDSLASLDMPGYGCGLLYDYGLFRQEIQDGHQVERPDHWLGRDSPWLIERASEPFVVPIYGRVEEGRDSRGSYNPMWLDWKVMIGVPYDMPIAGYGGRTVNRLRLFQARSSEEFDIDIFQQGDYIQAVQEKIRSETVSKLLYPSENVRAGRELRLVQEYFLVACAIRDLFRRFQRKHRDVRELPAKVAIQLNDTHPALAIAELMRVLVDENDIGWDEAWELTQATCAYTNHTLLPEALEKWPVAMLEQTLPRHLQIIYEINSGFLAKVRKQWPGDVERVRKLSLIEEEPQRSARMAHLAICGSHSVNGVAKLHTRLIRKTLAPEFHEMWPERFNNKTNGVTHRRCCWKASATAGSASRRACRISSASPTTPSSSSNSGRPSESTKNRWEHASLRAPGACPIHPRCSTSRSSASTSTNGNCSRSYTSSTAIFASSKTASSPRCPARSYSPARPRPATSWPS